MAVFVVDLAGAVVINRERGELRSKLFRVAQTQHKVFVRFQMRDSRCEKTLERSLRRE